jgi:Na+/H+-dicarboxylate symporter
MAPFAMPLLLVASWLSYDVTSVAWHGFVYGVGLTAQSVLFALLPWVVILLLVQSVSALASQGWWWMAVIAVAIMVSNAVTTSMGGISSYFMLPWLTGHADSLSMAASSGLPAVDPLVPLWVWRCPRWLTASQGLMLGVALGLALLGLPEGRRQSWLQFCSRLSGIGLRVISWLVPLFLVGFLYQMLHDRLLDRMVKDYGIVLCWMVVWGGVYIMALYGLVSGGSWSRFSLMFRAFVPPAMGGMCTMSSAAVMPLTIRAVGSLARRPQVSCALIPVTSNVHLVGDCLMIPLFALLILSHYGMPLPSFDAFVIFTGYFVLAKFSVAAVPGGGILVMLPILGSVFGFTEGMQATIFATYVLFDPLITAMNILGNGAFALAMDRLLGRKVAPSPL